MPSEAILDLAQCGELKQTLAARPPRMVHGTATVLTVMLGAAVVWSALTPVDLVVKAPGKVRPKT